MNRNRPQAAAIVPRPQGATTPQPSATSWVWPPTRPPRHERAELPEEKLRSHFTRQPPVGSTPEIPSMPSEVTSCPYPSLNHPIRLPDSRARNSLHAPRTQSVLEFGRPLPPSTPEHARRPMELGVQVNRRTKADCRTFRTSHPRNRLPSLSNPPQPDQTQAKNSDLVLHPPLGIHRSTSFPTGTTTSVAASPSRVRVRRTSS
jgi:hypothetical protein